MGKVDIDGALHIIKVTSVVLFLVSIGCTYTGIMTLKYSAPYWQFPFVTGSGVWTGISTLVAAVLGLSWSRYFDHGDVKKTRCQAVAMYTFVIMNITFGGLHAAYSGVGYSNCYRESSERVTDGIQTITCNPEERPRLMLMEALNISFGAIIVLISVFFIIYISVGGKLAALTGANERVRYVPCCNGRCHCEIGEGYA